MRACHGTGYQERQLHKKKVDLSALPFEIINDPTPRYRMGQIMGTVIGGVIGGILLFLADEPLFAIPLLALAGWSLVFGEIQVCVVAPKKKVT